ncbi:MAG: hypothetical protein SF066_13735 [Thermoanaerobaculia bacterium]|nr:hypothetical protein [Thermoanaerobaculia bacterium]
MLGVKTYPQDYIDRCRVRFEAAVADFDDAAARPGLEVPYFNHWVLILDYCFVHRLRTVEGKDGNPLNEVRVLCSSLLENEGKFRPLDNIKLRPEASILKYRAGDEIRIRRDDFVSLASAFLAEIERKFSA